MVEVAAEIDDRADGLRTEDETIAELPRGKTGDPSREKRRDHRSRALDVGHRWMKDIGRDEALAIRLTGNEKVRVCQVPRLERALDEGMIFAVDEPRQFRVSQAKTPPPFVVARDIGNGVGHLRIAVEVRLEPRERHPLVDRHRIADNVEIIFAQARQSVSPGPSQPGLADVPLLGYDPIEAFGPARNLVHDQVSEYLTFYERKWLVHSVAGDGSTDRE